MATSVIRSFVAKALFKKKGAIANKKAVEFSAKAIEQRLINIGIDPNAIRSEQELNQILNLVKIAEDRAFSQQFGDTLAGSRFDKPADVLDMTGKKIDPSKGIMGGKQLTDSPLGDLKSIVDDSKPIGDDLPPPGSRGGKDDIAAPFQSSDESLKNMIEAENKAAAERIRNKKMVKDAIDNMSPTFVKGDRKYNAQMVAEDLAEKRFNKDFYDLDQKQQTDIYGEALDGLDDSDKFAQGGRAGYKFGLGPLFNFLNKKSPMKAYTDYLESVKKRMKAGKEAEVAGEVIPIAAGGALITNQLKKKLKAMNEEQKKKIEKEAQEELRKDMKKANGGRIGYDKGSKLTDFIDVQAEGTKSGKKQLQGAPEGITADRESINAIIKADIPISQKIDLLAKYQYGKGRTKIERDGQEIFLDEGGSKSRDIGFGFNKDGEGIGGTLMYNMETGKPEFNIGFKKSFADGGRIGLAKGMTKRAFLKLMGGTGAAIGAAKSGIFSGFGKGAGKQVAEEVVKKSTSTPPPYFFELANKIKMLGKPDKVTYADRVEIHRYRGKNGDEYELIEDLNTGDVRITKDKTGIGSSGDKTFDTIEDRTVLEYKKGDADVDPESGTAFKSADEYEEYKVEFDADGTPADATDLDAVVQKEIIEEATGDAPSIKKAGGGIARMLGE
jgi:hypothetical protein